MRRAIVAVGALAVAGLTFGTAAPTVTRATGAAQPLRMTVGALGKVGSLDPRNGDGAIAREVWNLQYLTLTALDPETLDTATGLANAWAPAPGGHGWIYTLRGDAKWSDGQPVTPSDVVYSLEHARDEHWPSASGIVDGLDGRALSGNRVEIVSKNADFTQPGLLLHVVPAHIYSKVADVDADPTALAVADGPWHVVSRTDDSVALDARRPGGPPLDQIVFGTYHSAGALIDALARGRVDVVGGVPTAELGRLESLPAVTVDHAGDGTQYVLRVALPDVRDRRAISLALDRAELVRAVVNGVGAPTVVPAVARGADWRFNDTTVQSLTASLDAQPGRARRLITAAPPLDRSLSLVVPSDSTGRRLATVVRKTLITFGVKTTLVPEGRLRDPDLRIEHTEVADDPTAALAALRCDRCEALFRQFRSTNDLVTRLDNAHTMVARATEQATITALFEPDTLQAFRTDKLSGFLPQPELRRLVVFGPTVQQYSAIIPAPRSPVEQSSGATYALGAFVFLALCAGSYRIASRLRRRLVS